MGFEVIEDLATADRLSEARLLWYGLRDPSVHGGYVAAPWPTDIASPSHMQKTWGGYIFLVLLEDWLLVAAYGLLTHVREVTGEVVARQH